MLMSNAVEYGKLSDGTPVTKLAAGSFASIQLFLGYALMQLYNMTVWPDEERELSREERANPHIILGRNADGSIRVFRNTGALGDFLEWFGINTLVARFPMWQNEQMTTGDLLKEMAKDPANKVIHGVAPWWKWPWFEGLQGKSTFPDAFNARPIDRTEEAFAAWDMRDPYREFRGRFGGLQFTGNVTLPFIPDFTPTGERARPGSLTSTVTRPLDREMPMTIVPWRHFGQGDPKQYALSEAYGLRDKFLKKNDESIPRRGSQMFKNMRQAAIVGNQKAFNEAREAFIKEKLNKPRFENYADVYESFKHSLNSLDPIDRAMSPEMEAKFAKWLSGPQRSRVQMARDFAQDLKIQMWAMWQQAAEKDPEPQQRVNVEQTNIEIRRKVDVLSRPRPMAVTREQRQEGVKLADLRTKWDTDRDAALKWLKDRGIPRDRALRAYNEFLKREYVERKTRARKYRSANAALSSIDTQ
jgi:hypothetical protein